MCCIIHSALGLSLENEIVIESLGSVQGISKQELYELGVQFKEAVDSRKTDRAIEIINYGFPQERQIVYFSSGKLRDHQQSPYWSINLGLNPIQYAAYKKHKKLFSQEKRI